MHNYKNKSYAAAIPSLKETLELYPGHALARQYLEVAEAKQGTAEDATGRQSDVKGISVETDGHVALDNRRGRRAAGGGGAGGPRGGAPGQPPAASTAPRRRRRPGALREGAGAAATRPPGGADHPARAGGLAQARPRPPAPGRAPVATARRPAPAAEEVGFCTECGRPVEPEHKFCGYCGHKAR